MQKNENSEKERLWVLLFILVVIFITPLLLFTGYDPLGDTLREMFGESTNTEHALIFFVIFLVYWFFGRRKQ